MTPARRTRLETWREPVLYLAVYGIASMQWLCYWLYTASDCHGPGAAYPGGCPAYSEGLDRQAAFFILGGFVILLLLQGALRLRPLEEKYRFLIFVLYAAFLVFGPSFLLVPPPKA